MTIFEGSDFRPEQPERRTELPPEAFASFGPEPTELPITHISATESMPEWGADWPDDDEFEAEEIRRREPLYEVILPQDYPSRGIGEMVPLDKACVFDLMPPILGVQFMTDERLRGYVYFAGEDCGSFLDTSRAYEKAARKTLTYSTTPHDALVAYKAALHGTLDFTRAVSGLQRIALVNDNELQCLGIEQFEDLENRLIARVDASQPIDFEAYGAFVRQVAQDEQRAQTLYGTIADKHAERIPGGVDPHETQECINLYVKMRKFGIAASVAEDQGWGDQAAFYRQLAATESPRNTFPMNKAKAKVERERMAGEIKHGW